MEWLQPWVIQLDQQGPIADTVEQLQAQCDWLKVMYSMIQYIIVYYVVNYCILPQNCEDSVSNKEQEISRVLNVQLKLQSGPRLNEFNEMKRNFTVMWGDFNDKVGLSVCLCLPASLCNVSMILVVMLMVPMTTERWSCRTKYDCHR